MAARHGRAAAGPAEARLFGRDVQVLRTTPSPSAAALPSAPASERILTDGAGGAAPAVRHAEGIGLAWGSGIFLGSMLAVLLLLGLLSLSGRLWGRQRRAVEAKDQSLPTQSSSSSDGADAEEPPVASGPRGAPVAAAAGVRAVGHQASPQLFARSPMGQALPKATSAVYSPAAPQARSFALQRGCTLDLAPAPGAAQRPALHVAAQPQYGGPGAPDSAVTCLTPRSSATRQTDCELGGATPVETRQEYD